MTAQKLQEYCVDTVVMFHVQVSQALGLMEEKLF
jgi:hypothetical protein